MSSSDIAVVTCSVTGVLTDPAQHNVPVTVEEMAASAKEAFDAGATVMHVHFRNQAPNMGRLPSWDPIVAVAICDAIRASCPGVLINMTTGIPGRNQQPAIDCLNALKPEMAACNAGSLNYLKVRSNGTWAWPPMVFENTVDKVEEMVKAMKETNTRPEFECFDTGIVRSIKMYQEVGMVENPEYNLVMGVASGMACDPDWLPLLKKEMVDNASWQVTAIGREEVWPLHQRTAELGGHLRTGVEDTFYLPNGEKTSGNGQLIEEIVKCGERAGRKIATPEQAREIMCVK